MAPQGEERTLRAINYHLKNTSVQNLPKIIGSLTSQLVSSNCSITSSSIEATYLKTRTTTLLQDKFQEGRLCGVILAKAILSLAGSQLVLGDNTKDRLIATWLRALLDLIKKPGLTTTKQCAVLTVTRIFMLTWVNTTAVRELTTPTLPTFITTCLQLFQGQGAPGMPRTWTQIQIDLLIYVLDAFAALLPRHPTVFRSYAAQIRALCVATLCADPSSGESAVSLETRGAASQILALLHQCAQKGGGAAEWEKGLDELLSVTHATIDQVFRAVFEDWQSVAGVRSTISSSESEDLPSHPHMSNEITGLPGWTGLHAGLEHVHSLLGLLQAYLATPTASSAKLPLGRIVDLLTRILYTQAPRSKDPLGTRYNPQISREEREQLFSALPDLHVSTLDVISTLLHRLGGSALPICAHLLDLLTWIFQAESYDVNMRAAIYTCTGRILELVGPSLSKHTVKSMNKIIQACCKDLLPSSNDQRDQANLPGTETLNAQLTTPKGDGNTTNNSKASSNDIQTLARSFPGLYAAAASFLPILYTRLPTAHIPKQTRTLMDRTAILTSDTQVLAASVLNPAVGKGSLLPFLVASHDGRQGTAMEQSVVEALIRPRVPVILDGQRKQSANDQGNGLGDEEVESEDGEEEDKGEETAASQAKDEDVSMYEPKVVDWAAVSDRKGAGSAVTGKTKVSFGNLKDATSASASQEGDKKKRGAETSHSEVLGDAGAKRVKVAKSSDQEPEAEPLSMMREAPVVLDQRQGLSASAGAHAGNEVEEEAKDDDDDGSDFEIPALVMRTEFGDDDAEDEDAE